MTARHPPACGSGQQPPSTLYRAERAQGPLRLLLCCLLGYAPVVLAADWFFTLRPGETPAQLTQRCCGDAQKTDELLAYNRLDMRYPPAVGSRLRVPVEWLLIQPQSASVVFVKGTVTDGAAQPVGVGSNLAMGATLNTGVQSMAVVQFADQSTLQLGENAQVVFDLLSAYGDSGMVDTLLRFNFGRGELRVTPSTTNRFRIATPTGIAAVRGTQFRIGAVNAGPRPKALLETTEGSVAMRAKAAAGNEVLVPAGFGAVADATGVTKESLLAAPLSVQVTPRRGKSLKASWTKIPGANRYIVHLAQVTPAGLRPFATRQLRANSVRFANLIPGQYQVRVRGIAASGLHGMDALNQVELKAPAPKTTRWWPLSLLAIPLLLL